MNVAANTIAAVFAAIAATAIPRLLFPDVFGRWHEMVEAARDWLTVGLTTGVLYSIGILAYITISDEAADTPQKWFALRLPLLLISAGAGLLAARRLAINDEGVLSRGSGTAFGQVVMQAFMVALLYNPFYIFVSWLTDNPLAGRVCGAIGLGSALLAYGIVFLAWRADRRLTDLQRQARTTGNVTGDGPVPMTLTIIGGRESGKTVLLAGAYYEWMMNNTKSLIIEPAKNVDNATRGGAYYNLGEIAKRLYMDYEWPLGDVACHNLPFNLSLRNGGEAVARFDILDFPGGAVGGNADPAAVEEFWGRIEETDGLVLVADMSYVRRGLRDPDFFEVKQAFKTAMQRIVIRNGRTRVVPVALVLTKCDEFIDLESGQVNQQAIMDGLRSYGYDELEMAWRELSAESGPGFVEFSVWYTSAITYSRPRKDSSGRYDFTKPYEMAPPPPITPTHCAGPFLWLTAKVMRWNVTMFRDLSSFLLGSSPKGRRQIDAILRLEELVAAPPSG